VRLLPADREDVANLACAISGRCPGAAAETVLYLWRSFGTTVQPIFVVPATHKQTSPALAWRARRGPATDIEFNRSLTFMIY
jgi:hypothetical protein